jgi:hypothetical protein
VRKALTSRGTIAIAPTPCWAIGAENSRLSGSSSTGGGRRAAEHGRIRVVAIDRAGSTRRSRSPPVARATRGRTARRCRCERPALSAWLVRHRRASDTTEAVAEIDTDEVERTGDPA